VCQAELARLRLELQRTQSKLDGTSAQLTEMRGERDAVLRELASARAFFDEARVREDDFAAKVAQLQSELKSMAEFNVPREGGWWRCRDGARGDRVI
jgi:chromosome segregation ATPase